VIKIGFRGTQKWIFCKTKNKKFCINIYLFLFSGGKAIRVKLSSASEFYITNSKVKLSDMYPALAPSNRRFFLQRTRFSK
jgi:hypothetical protein